MEKATSDPPQARGRQVLYLKVSKNYFKGADNLCFGDYQCLQSIKGEANKEAGKPPETNAMKEGTLGKRIEKDYTN